MNASETGIVREAIWQLDHGQRLAARGILTRLLLSQRSSRSSDVSAPRPADPAARFIGDLRRVGADVQRDGNSLIVIFPEPGKEGVTS